MNTERMLKLQAPVPTILTRDIRSQGGFTLIELMVTVAVAVILVSIAVPNYRSYVQRANRSDATTALLRIAAAQEKFYIQNNTYTTDLTAAGLGIEVTNNGYYTLSVAAGANGLTVGYTATATATAGKRQAADSYCQTFTIDERGARGSAPSAVDVCWK